MHTKAFQNTLNILASNPILQHIKDYLKGRQQEVTEEQRHVQDPRE